MIKLLLTRHILTQFITQQKQNILQKKNEKHHQRK